MTGRTPMRVGLAVGLVAAAVLLATRLLDRPPPPPAQALRQAVYTPPGRGFVARPEPFWVRANLHSHALWIKGGVGDDGRSPARVMHEVYERLGYDFSTHSPHSNRNTSRRSPDIWLTQKEYEEEALDQHLSIARSLSVELSVAHGPNLRWFKVRRYGRGVGRTINHALIFGVDEYTPHLLPLKAAAEMAHVYGGLISIAHPVIWEADYFTLPGNMDKLDALEVYNGIVLAKTGETEEVTFRAAVSYSGGQARLAAVAGTDSHGLAWAKDLVTWVRTTSNDVDGIVEGIRRRRTFATRGFFDISLDFPQLGRVTRSGNVALDLQLNRPVERIELWREKELAQEWEGTDRVRWRERVIENTAYAFRFEDGTEFGYTSPVWFEPNPERLPDLTVSADDIELRGSTVQATVRNAGDAPAEGVRVAMYGVLPYKGARPLWEKTIERLGAGDGARLEARLKKTPELVYVKVDPESYGRADDDAIRESDERNNAAILVRSGPRRARLDRAAAMRQRRLARRAERGFTRRAIRRPGGPSTPLLPEHGELPELEDHPE